MTDTIRELVIQSIVARAAVILHVASPPSGYETDCGETVLRARPKVGPDDLPCIVVWPQIEEAENTHGQSRHRMPVQVDGLVKFGAVDPSIMAERILGDLIKCFTSPLWSRSPDYIESIVYQGGGGQAPEEGSVSVGAQAKFLVTYWTNTGDPYTR